MKKKPDFSCTHGLLCIYYAPSFVTLVSFYLNFTTRVYAKQQTTTAVRVYSLHEFRYANFAQKLVIFPSFFFRQYRPGKCIFQNEKTPFQALKTTSSKSRKTDIFPKRFTYGFGQKMAPFSSFFFRQYRPRKSLLRYSKPKNAFLGYKYNWFKTSKN